MVKDMAAIDFDFQRYVARRKGQRAAQVREGAAYAYPGDVRLLRTLDKLRPVQLALEETARLWRHGAQSDLLGPALRASSEHFPHVHRAARRCAELLHIPTPQVFVAPQPSGVLTLGSDEESCIVLSQGLLDSLSPAELLDVLGRECGRVQNGHVLFRTALHHLTHATSTLVRWAVKPATLTLQAWARRAEITADRAGLLCTRELDISIVGMQRSTAGLSDENVAKELDRRKRALTRFASSAYFRMVVGKDNPDSGDGPDGESRDACDDAVALILDDKDPPSA